MIWFGQKEDSSNSTYTAHTIIIASIRSGLEIKSSTNIQTSIPCLTPQWIREHLLWSYFYTFPCFICSSHYTLHISLHMSVSTAQWLWWQVAQWLLQKQQIPAAISCIQHTKRTKKPYVQTQYNYETNYFFAGVNLNFKNYARAQQKTQTHRNVIESVVKAATSSSFLASLTSTVNRMSQRLCVHFTQGLRLRTIQHTNPISLSSNTSDTIREHGKKIIWLEFCSLYSVQTWFNNTIHSHITAFSCIYDTPNYKMQVLIINLCKNYYGQDAHIQCHS